MPQDGVAETLGREGRGKPSTCVSATQLVGGRDLASGSMGRLQKRWKRVIPRTVSCPSTFALSTLQLAVYQRGNYVTHRDRPRAAQGYDWQNFGRADAL